MSVLDARWIRGPSGEAHLAEPAEDAATLCGMSPLDPDRWTIVAKGREVRRCDRCQEMAR